jgi:hypothetical protein
MTSAIGDLSGVMDGSHCGAVLASSVDTSGLLGGRVRAVDRLRIHCAAFTTPRSRFASYAPSPQSGRHEECSPTSIMYRACIALVDAARARLLTFERMTAGTDLREELVERTDFMSPQRRGARDARAAAG